jgi:hypothetical protein
MPRRYCIVNRGGDIQEVGCFLDISGLRSDVVIPAPSKWYANAALKRCPNKFFNDGLSSVFRMAPNSFKNIAILQPVNQKFGKLFPDIL